MAGSVICYYIIKEQNCQLPIVVFTQENLNYFARSEYT
nr:MAG TPA: hypothetical protein [Caudoviricetes sp.]